MSHFAEVKNGIVTNVIVAEQDFIDGLENAIEWIQTSYNTRGGIHLNGGVALRGNFAGVGFTYDKVKDVFIPPHTYPSWILNETTLDWEAPTPIPLDGKYYEWDEPTTSWKEVI